MTEVLHPLLLEFGISEKVVNEFLYIFMCKIMNQMKQKLKYLQLNLSVTNFLYIKSNSRFRGASLTSLYGFSLRERDSFTFRIEIDFHLIQRLINC